MIRNRGRILKHDRETEALFLNMMWNKGRTVFINMMWNRGRILKHDRETEAVFIHMRLKTGCIHKRDVKS